MYQERKGNIKGIIELPELTERDDFEVNFRLKTRDRKREGKGNERRKGETNKLIRCVCVFFNDE